MAGRPKRAESTLAVSLGEFQRKEAAVEAARRGEIEASVRREVELQFRDKAGPVYRALEAEIRARLLKEERIRAETVGSLELERKQLRVALACEYDEKARRCERRLADECRRLAADYQAKLVAMRAKAAREHAEELLRVRAEYARQLEAAEAASRASAAEAEARARAEAERAKAEVAAALDAHVVEVDAKVLAGRDAELAQLQRRLEDLEEARAALRDERAPVFDALQRKLDGALGRLSAQDEAARARRDAAHARELELVEGAVEDERRMHAETSEQLEAAHVRQIEVMLETLYEHQQEVEHGREAFEETLQNKYLAMLAALKDRVRLEHEAQVRRALDALEKTVRAESKRAQQAYSDQSRAELSASLKFKGLVAKLRRLWGAEEATRGEALEQRLHTHYELVLRHVRHQLGLALELHASSDAAWLADLEARHARQVGALRAHEAKCTRLYDGRLREYTERAAAQLEGAQDALLDGRGAAAAERARLESRVWRLKAQCARWRADLMAATQERFHAAVAEIEGRYAAVVASQADELARAREELCLHELRLGERNGAIEQARAGLRRAADERERRANNQS